LSTVVPNRPESDPIISGAPILGQQRDVVLRLSAPAAPPQATAPARRKAKAGRQLTPQKISFAWEKVRRVVRDLCRQRGEECVLCKPYGSRIEFQLTAEYRPVTLELDGDRIVARIGGKHWTIRMVRIRGGGSGYVLRKKIRTATFVLIELISEARQWPEIGKERPNRRIANEHTSHSEAGYLSVVQRK
jgi:hypothetical protein